MVRRHGTSAGAASRTGTPLFSPAFTSSRNTVLAASLSARPRGVKIRRGGGVAGRGTGLLGLRGPAGARRDDQRTGASGPELHVRELDLAPELVADPDVAIEGEGRAGVHAPWH